LFILVVRLLVRNICPRPLTNLVVLDLLPGDFEVDAGSLWPGRGTVDGVDCIEMREDRNVFFLPLERTGTRTIECRIKQVPAGALRRANGPCGKHVRPGGQGAQPRRPHRSRGTVTAGAGDKRHHHMINGMSDIRQRPADGQSSRQDSPMSAPVKCIVSDIMYKFLAR
jgi:hypothetical protein